MKKYPSLLILFLLYCFKGQAQDDYPCSDFNTSDIGSWTTVNCFLNTMGSPYTNPLDHSRAVSVKDNHGFSTFENSVDFQELGTRFLGDCISFDYNVTNDGFSDSTVLLHPVLYLSDIMGRTISFTGYATITEGSGWVHVRAPIALYDPVSKTYPSNEDGRWNFPAMMPDDFNYIINHSVKLFFSLDVAGSNATTEDVRFDNVCISKCRDSLSKSCNANFEFTLIKSTKPADPVNNTGSITLSDYHTNSTYHYYWDDATVTDIPEQHKYRQGLHTVKVKETTEKGIECTSNLKICVTDKTTFKTTETTADTGCGLNFIVDLTSATNKPLLYNNIGNITVRAANPDSKYLYDWGDKSFDNQPAMHHYYYPGNYTVCVTELKKDLSVCKNCLGICVIDPQPLSTAIPEITIKNEKELIVIPNPAYDKTEISFTLAGKNSISIGVFNLSGQLVIRSAARDYGPGVQKIQLDTRDLAAGMYILALSNGNAVQYAKLCVAK